MQLWNRKKITELSEKTGKDFEALAAYWGDKGCSTETFFHDVNAFVEAFHTCLLKIEKREEEKKRANDPKKPQPIEKSFSSTALIGPPKIPSDISNFKFNSKKTQK